MKVIASLAVLLLIVSYAEWTYAQRLGQNSTRQVPPPAINTDRAKKVDPPPYNVREYDEKRDNPGVGKRRMCMGHICDEWQETKWGPKCVRKHLDCVDY
jgi:hypothetical protein